MTMAKTEEQKTTATETSLLSSLQPPPSFLLVILVGTFSWWLAQFFPSIGSVTIAILLGILVGNITPNVSDYRNGMLFAEKRILPVAIALLGVELQLATLAELGPFAAIVIFGSIGTALLVSIRVGKMFGYTRRFSILMGAGNGICGSSAVAATGIALNSDEKDTGLAISVVNLLGTLGIFLLPTIVQLLGFETTESGLLIGGTLQAVGQVVAAGFALGDDVGSVATVVKMGRVLMLGPVVILLFTLMNRRQSGGNTPSPISIPWFIVGFAVLSVISSIGLFSNEMIDFIKVGGKYLLVIAMAGVGMRIHFLTLYRAGPKAFLFGAMVSSSQLIVTLLLIMLLMRL